MCLNGSQQYSPQHQRQVANRKTKAREQIIKLYAYEKKLSVRNRKRQKFTKPVKPKKQPPPVRPQPGVRSIAGKRVRARKHDGAWKHWPQHVQPKHDTGNSNHAVPTTTPAVNPGRLLSDRGRPCSGRGASLLLAVLTPGADSTPFKDAVIGALVLPPNFVQRHILKAPTTPKKRCYVTVWSR
ncbi:hypothetical protein HPB51_010295 [Rhipicephalus microplus]|uniref:Uncharacterized protein n=1 Tax=Rhipicephalus microplus TaxID=6941 RepID=A0A9J6D4W6_RHIMP|nr:hypothetical protein HPB51_010295 [Rhipicephalus microplus]